MTTFTPGDTGRTPVCQTCEGSGSVGVPISNPVCCCQSVNGECGAQGCVGPFEEVEWQPDLCPDCGGAGTADGSDPLDLLPPDRSE